MMKVSELIEALKKIPSDPEVRTFVTQACINQAYYEFNHIGRIKDIDSSLSKEIVYLDIGDKNGD